MYDHIVYQGDDRKVASDGFMLNVMSIVQQLCVKVKSDKVGFHFAFVHVSPISYGWLFIPYFLSLVYYTV